MLLAASRCTDANDMEVVRHQNVERRDSTSHLLQLFKVSFRVVLFISELLVMRESVDL